MAEMMGVEVLGIVENYSYIVCPDCGKEIKMFGESYIKEICGDLNVALLGQMPMDQKFAQAADAGKIYEVENSYISIAKDALELLDK